MNKNKALIACACASIAIHAGALFILSQSRLPVARLSSHAVLTLERQQSILAEAFAPSVGEWARPLPEENRLVLRTVTVHATVPQETLAPAPVTSVRPLPFSPRLHLDLFDSVVQESLLSRWEDEIRIEQHSVTPFCAAPLMKLQAMATPEQPMVSAEQTVYAERVPVRVLQPPSIRAEAPVPSMSQWPHLPTLSELETVSCSELFDVDLSFTPLGVGEGVFFVLTLVPCEELPLPKLKHHYIFLIDRSNSIQQDRLAATKWAVSKALDLLDPEDTFQIFAFDSRIEKCATVPLTPRASTLAQARVFLDQITLGSFFSQSELALPLFLSIPARVAPNETYTALLFTDGDALTKKDRGLSLFREWMDRNEGRLSLYVISKDSDVALPTLDAASALSRGRLISYSGKWGLKRRLLKLMKSIHAPVAKEIVCSAVSNASNSRVTLFSMPESTPPLYRGQPYVICGTAPSMDDFVLFVQGRFQDRWINIKKHISFLSAKKGGNSLKTEWALQQAYRWYARYLHQGNPACLAEARGILIPHRISVAFE